MADLGGESASLLMGPFDPSAFTGESDSPWEQCGECFREMFGNCLLVPSLR